MLTSDFCQKIFLGSPVISGCHRLNLPQNDRSNNNRALSTVKGIFDLKKYRHALVIGNGDYLHPPVKTLRNPINDAREITRALRKCGYSVTPKYNLNAADFADTVNEFERKVDGADVAVVFYSGHGISNRSKNYLLHIDAQLLGKVDLDKFVSVEDVINRLARVSDKTVFFFDACRNVFGQADDERAIDETGSEPKKISVSTIELASGMTDFSLDDGLGELFIYFATSPNKVAREGSGTNSPFTEALLENLNIPGLGITEHSSRVNKSVWAKTKNGQRPWPINLTTKPLYFKERSLFPAIATVVAGILSGLLVLWFGKVEFLRLWNLELLPGVLFATTMLVAFRVTGTHVKMLLFFMITLAVWFVCGLLLPFLDHEMTNYVIRLDPKSLDPTDKNYQQKFQQITASHNFFRDYGGAVTGFVVGSCGALLLTLGTALAVVRARQVSIGIVAVIAGGLAPLLAIVLSNVLDFPIDIHGLAVFIWQSLMALFIGLSVAYWVPSNESEIAVYFQQPINFHRPVIRYSSNVFLLLAIASGLASTALTIGYPETLKPIAAAMVLWDVPSGSSVLFGLLLASIALTRRSNFLAAAAVPLVTQIAWFCAFRSAVYLDGGLSGADGGLSIEVVFGTAGFVGSAILIVGLWLFQPAMRNWRNLIIFPLLGVVATIPYTMISPKIFGGDNQDLANFFSWVLLFVPWQVAITAAYIHSFDAADRSAS